MSVSIEKCLFLVLCVIPINSLTLALPVILLGLLENRFLRWYCLVIVQFLSPPPPTWSSFVTLTALPQWFCLFYFELLSPSLWKAEWLSVFHCATPWPVGVFGSRKVARMAKWVPPHQCPSEEICRSLSLQWATHWRLSSTAAPPTRMAIKGDILSTHPEIAKQPAMVQIRKADKSWSRICGLAATAAVICSTTKHTFPTVLGCLDDPT